MSQFILCAILQCQNYQRLSKRLLLYFLKSTVYYHEFNCYEVLYPKRVFIVKENFK